MKPNGLTYSQLFLSTAGRIPRSTFWLYAFLPVLVVSMLVSGLDFVMGTYNQEIGIGILGGIWSVLLIYPWVCVLVKRAHDRDRSGLFVLLIMVPLVNLWPFVELYFLKGTTGPNQYGPDPLG